MSNLSYPGTKSMGLDYDRQSTAQWIQEVASEKRDDRSCTSIALVHKHGVEDGREVWVGLVNGRSADELAEIFERKAKSVAQDLGATGSGTQMFELWAFYGGRPTPEAWHPLVVRSKMPRDGFGSEGPAGHGPEAQRMRQGEGVFGQMFAKQAHLDRAQAEMITFLGTSLVSALRDNAQLSRDAIAAMRREADRAHEYRMAEIREMKSLAFTEKLMNIAPPLMNTAFGKEVFPQSTADTAMFTTIVEGMVDKNPALLEMFVDGFKENPEIHGLLAARVTEIVKAKTDREESREKILKAIPQTDPEADAGGQVIKLVQGDKR